MLQRLATGGSRWISRLAALNLLWMIVTVAGLGFLGIFPATFAVYQLVRDWQHRPECFDEPYVRRYLQLVGERLLSANLWGYGVTAAAGVVGLGFMVVKEAEGIAFQGPVLGLLAVAGIGLAGVAVHLPFVVAHVEAPRRRQAQASLFYAACHPLETLSVIAAVVGLSFLFGRWPGLAFFLTISPIALLTVTLDLIGFRRLERRAQHPAPA